MEKQKKALSLINQAVTALKASQNQIDMDVRYHLEQQATVLRNRIGDFEANQPKSIATTAEVLGQEPA
jgi:preprotein translocase subunit SecD